MLIDKDKCCLIIFNMQKEFIPTLRNSQALIDSTCWLADLASHFDIPVFIVEHLKLGEPLKSLRELAKGATITEIDTFSCLKDEKTKELLEKSGRTQFILAGSESHVTLFQSAVDFKKEGKECFVLVDAMSARSDVDQKYAIKRLIQLDIPVVTKEMLFFEILRRSTYPNYLNLSLKFLDGRYMRD